MTTAEELVMRFRAAGLTCATAESCTGGGVGAAITTAAGASAVFRGGVISYQNDVKAGVLGVERSVLESVGPVSAACAKQMAAGARKLLAADCAVSVTGVAGPGSDGGHPAGCVWFGLATEKTVTAHVMQFAGDRAAVRAAAVEHALTVLMACNQTPDTRHQAPGTRHQAPGTNDGLARVRTHGHTMS